MINDITTSTVGAAPASPSFLSLDVLREKSPAVFASKAHERVSDKYRFVPSLDIITKLDEYGFKVVDVKNPMKKQHGKTGPLVPSETGAHMVTFEPEIPQTLDGEGRLQVVMINSHDRTKRFRLAAGFLRFVCSNGLIAGTGDLQVKATHLDGHLLALDEQIEGALTHANRLVHMVGGMQAKKLSKPAQLSFARQAMAIRFGNEKLWRVEPKQILAPRREADEGDDLWRVFNRVQENLVRGGIRNTNTPMPTMPLSRPRQTFNFNSKLWELAEGVMTTK